MTKSGQPVSERVAVLRRRFPPFRRMMAGPIGAIPLVNVALLAMLFFLVNSHFVLQPGITVNLPTSAFAGGAPVGAKVVTISQEGIVFFNDEPAKLDELGAELAQSVAERPDAALVIEADGRVSHSTIIEVYNLAMAAGVKDIVLATRLPAAAPGAAQ